MAKEYIEREALKKEFDERYDTAFVQERTRENKEFWNGLCSGVNWGRNTIADAPAADVVEVVRCKDCKFWDCYGGEDEHKGDCLELELDCCMYEDDFCSYGERRTDDGNKENL